MNPDLSTVPGVVAVVLVTVATLAIGTWGLRFSRTTSDFFVASRTVRPRLNASAIGGEYLSAASFLGVAGLVLTFGADMLWYPVGWTAGYLVLMVLVAAPLRRSGAYTLPDFAEARLGSTGVRRLSSVLVVVIGWLYLLPQFQGAGVTLEAAIGAPEWLGPTVVGLVVLAGVSSGGMRSITFVQAFQYWLKLTALLIPAMVLLVVWLGDGAPNPADAGSAGSGADLWSLPLADGGGQGLYVTYSLIIATFLGTMGLPHVVVRFYTNPDGRAARRTTLVVLVLLGAFYLLPPIYGALGRIYASDLVAGGGSDVLVLELPRLMVPGLLGDLLAGLVTAGAFAAFLSTSSGSDDRGGRCAEPGRHRSPVGSVPARADHGVPGRRGRRRARADAGLAGRTRDGGRPHGRTGVRGRRLDVLPAAAARHLVAGADRRRRGRRAARRRAGVRRCRRVDVRDRRHRRLGSGAARPAGGLERARCAGHDDRGQPPHPRPGADPRGPVHGPAAHPGGGRARTRVNPPSG